MNLKNYAYIGDALWELFIRERTIKLTNNAQKLHKLTTSKVKASYQAALLHKLEPELTEAENDISRRARNLPTSFETLIGWWYLNDRERYLEILTGIELELKF